jgi:PAS domain-containing protein
MELALAAVANAICWTDEQGRVQWCNAVFDRLVGKAHLEVLGADASELVVLRKPGRKPGEPGAILTVRDLTERVLAEAELRVKEQQLAFAQKLESLGRLRKLKSGVKVIYMSGYASAQSLRVIDQEGQPFITKPFRPADLVSKIKTVLAS